MTDRPRILYCHCAFAKVIPNDVKQATLAGLIESQIDFEMVPDLCEMSARRDPLLSTLAEVPDLRIAACYGRAVQGLFRSAGYPLSTDPENAPQVVNMRICKADQVLVELLGPPGKNGETKIVGGDASKQTTPVDSSLPENE